MSAISVAALLVFTGVCAYGTASHISAALSQPLDRSHMLFAAMCLIFTGFGPTEAVVYSAQTVASYTLALKWNLTFSLAFYLVFPWFIAALSGVRPRVFLAVSTGLYAVLILYNLLQPYSLQFAQIDSLTVQRLPWGDVIARAEGHTAPALWFAAALVMSSFGFALYSVRAAWRRGHPDAKLPMMIAIALFLATSIEGILDRANVVDFVQLGALGVLTLVILMGITLNRQTREILAASERRFRSLIEQSPFGIQVLSPDGRTQQVNAAWVKLWGTDGATLGDQNILADRRLVEKGVMPYIQRGFAGVSAEAPPVLYSAAGGVAAHGWHPGRLVRTFVYPIKDAAGVLQQVIVMYEDVTERKRVEDAVRLIAKGASRPSGGDFFQEQVSNLAELFGANYAWIGTLDECDREWVNTLALYAHGKSAARPRYRLTGTPRANVVGGSTVAYRRDVRRLFPQDRLLAELSAEAYIGAPLFDASGAPLGVVEVMHNRPLGDSEQATEILKVFAARASAELQRERAEARMHRMAYEDYLTGLPNRAQLHERLSEARRVSCPAGTGSALLLVDLDHFKTINDALGHHVGDEVLRLIARRLTDSVGPHAFVARLGGDEFVVLVPCVPDAQQVALRLARHLSDVLASAVVVGEHALTVGASMGIALFAESGDSQHDVLRHAEMALYRAKSLGRGVIELYRPELQAEATHRLRLEEGLRHAVANGELALHYQAQVDSVGRVAGAEVLLRWRHAQLGNVPPASFIAVAEESGLIHSIGSWVLEQACARLTQWLQTGRLPVNYLSVNVSPWQFARPNFVEEVLRTLSTYQVDPGRLLLELTETALLYDIEEAIEKLQALRAIGLRVAMDDFGTGSSSLAYLRLLPLDQLKIDKVFIAEIGVEVEHPLVESMIAIGKHMKLQVVAEGVESEMQRLRLIELGCERFQGFLCCQPLPERDFLRWVDQVPVGEHPSARIA